MNFIQRYRLRKKLSRIAKQLEGTLRYVRSTDFGITGSHRGFPYYTRPILNGSEAEAVAICLRLNNPNQKALRLEKDGFLAAFTREWGGQACQHTFGSDTTMYTNDLIFSSAFLTDHAVAHIRHLLAHSPKVAFWVQGTELGCAIPVAVLSADIAADIRERLCEIKAGLG